MERRERRAAKEEQQHRAKAEATTRTPRYLPTKRSNKCLPETSIGGAKVHRRRRSSNTQGRIISVGDVRGMATFRASVRTSTRRVTSAEGLDTWRRPAGRKSPAMEHRRRPRRAKAKARRAREAAPMGTIWTNPALQRWPKKHGNAHIASRPIPKWL